MSMFNVTTYILYRHLYACVYLCNSGNKPNDGEGSGCEEEIVSI